MEKNEKLKGFQGIFLEAEIEQQLIHMQKNGLENNIKNMHITFKFGDTEKYPDELIGKKFKIKIVGYASDGKNSGFSVEIPEELKQYYISSSVPHITVSIGEVDGIKGKPVDTAKLDFKPLDKPIEVIGKLGYFIFGKGLSMDNNVINEYENKVGMDKKDRLAAEKELESLQEKDKQADELIKLAEEIIEKRKNEIDKKIITDDEKTVL